MVRTVSERSVTVHRTISVRTETERSETVHRPLSVRSETVHRTESVRSTFIVRRDAYDDYRSEPYDNRTPSWTRQDAILRTSCHIVHSRDAREKSTQMALETLDNAFAVSYSVITKNDYDSRNRQSKGCSKWRL